MQSKQEFLAAVHVFYLHCKELNIITLSFIKKKTYTNNTLISHTKIISSKYKTMEPRPTIGPKKVIYNITTHKAQKNCVNTYTTLNYKKMQKILNITVKATWLKAATQCP